MALSFRRTATILLSLGLGLGGCVQDLDVGGGGSGTTTGSGGTSTGGAGGQAGMCLDPGNQCFDGPEGTAVIGNCHPGTWVCNSGSSWGHCAGQVLPSFELCDVAGDENCDGSTECKPLAGWSKAFGDDAPTSTYFTASAVDHDNHLYLAGLTTAQSGFLDGKVFVMKLDPDGFVLWKKEYDSAGASITGLGVDAGQTIFVAGSVNGHVDFGGGALQSAQDDNDVFVARLGVTGEQIWAHRYGDATGRQGDHLRLALDDDGYPVVTAQFSGNIDFGTGPLTQDGPGTLKGAFVARLDPDGNGIYARKQSTSPDSASMLGGLFGMDATGAVVTGGQFSGDLDVGGPSLLHTDLDPTGPTGGYLAKYDRQGELLWQKAFDGALLAKVAVSPGGEIVTVGGLRADVDFGGGAISNGGDPAVSFVARWDSSGALIHAASFHSGTGVYFDAVTIRGDGIATLAVDYQGVLDLTDLGGQAYADSPQGAALIRLGPSDKQLNAWNYPLPASDFLEFRLVTEDMQGGLLLAGMYTGAADLGFGPLPVGDGHGFAAHYVP